MKPPTDLFSKIRPLIEVGIPIGVLLFGFYLTPFLVNQVLPAPFYMDNTRDPTTGAQMFSFVLNKQFIYSLVFFGWLLGLVTLFFLRKSMELYQQIQEPEEVQEGVRVET